MATCVNHVAKNLTSYLSAKIVEKSVLQNWPLLDGGADRK